MTGRIFVLLALLGLGVVLVGMRFQSVPGYMDAEYYYSGGARLATGAGFTEEILWNYLDDPDGLPHPSHGYWMPLVSILAAAGMRALGEVQFTAGRVAFLAFIAALPPLTASLSYTLIGSRLQAILAGLLAALPGFYLPYLATTDSFALSMTLGALFLLITRRHWRDAPKAYAPIASFLLGMIAGLMHLTRADGLMWLFMALVVVFLQAREIAKPGRVLALFGLCGCGYLLLMGPWMARNYMAFGALLSASGLRALWLTSYDELFIYPGDLLTFQRWWANGLQRIIADRLWAAGQNLQTALAVQGQIFLAPLILAGLWLLRMDRRVQAAVAAWLSTFLVMTVVFPYVGARGGFFHSGAALQPLWWAAAPLGLVALICWIGERRHWNLGQAKRFFGIGLIGLAVLISVIVYLSRVIGGDFSNPSWEAGYDRYTCLEAALVEMGIQERDVIMVNNPPGYYLASGRQAVSIPYGDLETVFKVAERYRARYLLLEIDQIQGQENLYTDPGDHPGISYLVSVDGTRIYQFQLLLVEISPYSQ